MAKVFPSIEPQIVKFIARQHIFFAASAAAKGYVNLSPRSTACLRVLDEHHVVYLDKTGSGNETAGHMARDGRMTLMFCAFEGPPLILRLYGQGRLVARGGSEYAALLAAHFDNSEPPGARHMIHLACKRVQTSCGYGVPQFGFESERTALDEWAARKGEAGLEAYRAEKNMISIDGLPIYA
ncbi:MAG: pyridoxamine 5'-phosphate oxidase family protein [Hyphomicrobiales bacterium]|nr:pyridoxamine 5'-phosphate oxidase family protein [Hyphomicrobiales bacterium]